MKKLFFERTKELKKELKNLEKKLQIKLTLEEKMLTIEGQAIEEYEAMPILEAIQFGFSAKKAFLLLENDMIFRIIPIKQFTRRKNLYEVRARIIGKEGKTKRTLENISNCEIIIKEDNNLGIIGSAESIEEVTTAITSLIKGAKQSNVYSFLERMNAIKKKQISDLGLKLKTPETSE